ncbi:MAG: hypothetical protein HFI43_05265 [Lachnospiraceae bacterium]|jgi:sporulation integral membrane protein YlbJ|nr:hypothetical protein [Lachnospiraceae bacterium]GFI15409.1 sporulation integral membrane protein YlbJ [Lachnospiraceae bacterium]
MKLNLYKRKFHKQKFYTLMAVGLTAVILLFPADCLSLALNGLNLWFGKMIPTLFPFMVLSGIMIRMNLTGAFVRMLNPVLGRIFKVNPSCIYGIVIGFLCGFPMGAHVAAQLCEQKQISAGEASFLLAFCNNIGPVYFLSFVLPTLFSGNISPGIKLCLLMGMYGLPLLYGLFLRYTMYRNIIDPDGHKYYSGQRTISLAKALDESVFNSLTSIARLGGYMIFFNLLFILPDLTSRILHLGSQASRTFVGSAGCLLEITGGIGLLGNQAPAFVLCVLPFGGLSCIAQTYSMIKNTSLSVTEYVMHKMILTALTVFYYLLTAKLWLLP